MKRSKERDKFYIQSMYEEIEKAEKFVKDETYKTFVKDEKLKYAIYKACENIGEAAKNISNGLKSRHQEIPWKEIIAYRNILAHEYFGVDTEETWKVMQKDIPELKRNIKKLMK
ncbi:MAG: DUF86 domain-containing protein [Elusimicrobiota bacterium]